MNPRRISTTPEQAKNQQIHYGTGEAIHYYDHWTEQEGKDNRTIHFFIFNPESIKEKGYTGYLKEYINENNTGHFLIDPMTKQKWVWMAYDDDYVLPDDNNPPYVTWHVMTGFLNQPTTASQKIDFKMNRANILQVELKRVENDRDNLYKKMRSMKKEVMDEMQELINFRNQNNPGEPEEPQL